MIRTKSSGLTDHPYLLEKIGQDIITASGKTLLGADDKAGVAQSLWNLHPA